MFNVKNVIEKIKTGHERSIRAKKNIVASFFISGGNIVVGLLLMPLTINYLDPAKYGIWITLSSILGWLGFFDVGLGHGLRNRFAEAKAKGDFKLVKTYVSTTYAILSFIILSLLVLFFLVNPFLNWNSILNADQAIVSVNELKMLAFIVFTFASLSFIFQPITSILYADQRPAMASLSDFISKIISLSIIFLLTKTTEGSLIHIGVVIAGAPLLVLVATNIWFFNMEYSRCKPSIKFVQFSRASDLLGLGAKFFIIRVSAILLYQTNYIIISHLFGPNVVTPYYVAFNYFNILMMGYTIVMAPFWTAFTDAWVKSDINWIKNIIRKLVYFWGLLIVVAIIMLIFSDFAFEFWIGGKVKISKSISALLLIWVLLNALAGIFSQFLNGVGKIKLQLRVALIGAMANVPVAVFLGRMIGIEGVLVTNILVATVAAVLYPLQYKFILSGRARGIWNK